MNGPADLLSLPAGFGEWNPVLQAITLAALTLVSEDGAAIGAALLSAVGLLEWRGSFCGIFLGIWFGDVALYAVARRWGRPLLAQPWVARRIPPARLAASERWFARVGGWALIACRVAPGTRLPTYLAAGLLRMPFATFLAITGAAAFAWSAAVFSLSFTLGTAVERFLPTARKAAVVIPLAIIAIWLLIAGLRRLADRKARWRFMGWVGRWRHWEFWPAWLFYAPVALYYAWLALRFRGCTLPTAANPGMTHGGMVGESKFDTLRELMATSPEVTASAFRIEAGPAVKPRVEQLLAAMDASGLMFPLVLKPDLGQRGLGIKVVRSAAEAAAYFASMAHAVVAQRYVAGPFEAGIFYVRMPGEAQGRILAITEKIFPRLVGDGKHTVEELIWRDRRARCMARRYLHRLNARRAEVLPAGETLRLVEAGNHAQGCIFRDGADWWSRQLELAMDEISRRLTGFHFGRYDVRFSCLEEFRAGRGFQILELNGAASEVTGIYDSRNTLVTAYRTLFRQWRIAHEIGAANRARGWIPTPARTLFAVWRSATRQFAACPDAD
jgi:membrane protein DedA with SNARE-associated domain